MTGRRLRQGHTWEAWRRYDRKTVKTKTHLICRCSKTYVNIVVNRKCVICIMFSLQCI